jgi:ribosome biogenesis GTPase / thiamine phosphate phosphatase
MKTGRIITLFERLLRYTVTHGTEDIQRTRARGEFRKSKQKPLVGDFVDFESDRDEGLIWAIHDRRNVLVRPPVANIDIAVIVTAVKEPDFTANLLDRQLVALEAAGVSPLIYFSKIDLLSSEEYLNHEKSKSRR